jgi:hypothetical protein
LTARDKHESPKQLAANLELLKLLRMVPKHNPIHPGEILREEFLEPPGIPQTKLAEQLGIPLGG